MKVSIIIPILNEIKYIEKCLISIIENTFCFNDSEILLVDGGSSDGTLDTIKKFTSHYSNIKLYKNSKKITPAALNIGIKNSKGKYIVRLDAHAIYPPNYIDLCISELENSDSTVVNAGGIISTQPSNKSILSKSISIVLSSVIGVGNSHFRTSKESEKSQFVETVPFGCFRRTIFDQIGLFDENEPRNEDLEFNKRILRSGKKIICNRKIVSIYYSRGSLYSFLSQAFDNGFIVTNNYRGAHSFHSLRHFIPLLFSLFFLASIAIIFFQDLQLQVFSIWALYFLILFIFSFNVFVKEKNILFIFSIPLITFLLHLFYGFGSILGLFSSRISKNE
jgi:glycosyltransferase involved in cell wall biosynthesis